MIRSDITVTQLTPTIGAEVGNVDLRTMDGHTRDALQALWDEHLVLFLRDQDLTREQLLEVAGQFGPLHIHPQGDVPGYPGLLKIHTDEHSTHYSGRKWHSDVTCDEEPPAGSVLHLSVVPPVGGDTLFANMYQAFETLSPAMQDFLMSLEAHHSGEPNMRGYFGQSADELRDGRYPTAVHPVVRTHPRTGRRALYVNEIFTTHIVGLEEDESQALLGFLFKHITEPRFQCRFRWEPNSVAMWDNRCVLHIATWDYFPHTRSGYRATIKGDRPYLAGANALSG